MLEQIFESIFDAGGKITVGDFLLCLLTGLAIGLLLALAYRFRSRCSRSFLATLAMLPAAVSAVIMMVNGNLGAGVAVAGAFGLVRFRSAPGTAREIGAIFLAMAAGLMTGMGYLGYGALFVVVMGLASVLLQCFGPGSRYDDPKTSVLRITVPEEMNYTGAFDDLFETYTAFCEQVGSKTTNLGSLFRLTYLVVLKDAGQEKAFIDALRCRNGNLEISLTRREQQEIL